MAGDHDAYARRESAQTLTTRFGNGHLFYLQVDLTETISVSIAGKPPTMLPAGALPLVSFGLPADSISRQTLTGCSNGAAVPFG